MSLESVLERVVAAAVKADRPPEDVTLVIVTKGQPVELIQSLYDRGQRDFGENRAQELASKVDELPTDMRWHFVGPLQSNKVRMVRPNVKVLHSLDRPGLAPAWIKGPGLAPPALLQVNIGREPQKHGVDPANVSQIFAELLALGVDLAGLMAIPPLSDDPEATRTYFQEMRRLGDLVATDHSRPVALSMGMSDDFEAAIEEGAAFVRVGRAIFADN